MVLWVTHIVARLPPLLCTLACNSLPLAPHTPQELGLISSEFIAASPPRSSIVPGHPGPYHPFPGALSPYGPGDDKYGGSGGGGGGDNGNGNGGSSAGFAAPATPLPGRNMGV